MRVVDWGQTIARGPRRFRPEYVVRSSGEAFADREEAQEDPRRKCSPEIVRKNALQARTENMMERG